MIFTYREVEGLFAARYGVLADRQLAFRGRLDRLRQLGCPSGVQTGKGRPATFGWDQLNELSLALDLVDVGFTPEAISNLLKANLEEAVFAISELGMHSPELIKSAAICERWPAQQTIYFKIKMNALSGLTDPDLGAQPLLEVINGKTLAARLLSSDIYEMPAVLLDLGTRIANLLLLITIWQNQEIDFVVGNFKDWAKKRRDQFLDEHVL